MKITTQQHPWNVYEGTTWTAIDDDSYDGPASPHGNGRTEREAIEDLCEQIFDNLDTDNDRLRHENRCLRREIEESRSAINRLIDDLKRATGTRVLELEEAE